MATTFGDKRRADARVAAIRGVALPSGAGTRDARPHLRAVEDQPARRSLPARLAGHRQLPPLSLHTVNLADQARFSARSIVGDLGWEETTQLRVYLDVDTPAAWVQLAEPPRPPEDTDGTPCSCGRCVDAAAALPELPGELRPTGDRVRLDGKGRLELTAGIAAALRIDASGRAAVLVLPELHALALAAPPVLLSGALASVISGPAGDVPASDGTNLTDTQEVGA